MSTDIHIRKLNKKLAEWAGLRLAQRPSDTGHYLFADKGGICYQADFTHSLDSCFEFLVPKLDSTRNIRDIQFLLLDQEVTPKHWACKIRYFLPRPNEPLEEFARSESPSLAFCLAVKKTYRQGV